MFVMEEHYLNISPYPKNTILYANKDNQMTPEQVTVDKTLLLQFFLTFSRFEFALKNARFRREAWHGDVEPDWNRFINEIADNNFNINQNNKLQEACEYILDDPPKRQVLFNGDLAWETQLLGEDETETTFLLKMVKSIRNNLFHGGKHNIGLHEDSLRIEKLLESSLEILSYCITLDPELEDNLKRSSI
jgi:hypothetical protein